MSFPVLHSLFHVFLPSLPPLFLSFFFFHSDWFHSNFPFSSLGWDLEKGTVDLILVHNYMNQKLQPLAGAEWSHNIPYLSVWVCPCLCHGCLVESHPEPRFLILVLVLRLRVVQCSLGIHVPFQGSSFLCSRAWHL